MSGGKDNDNVDLEWKNRILCSDESCIGTIGPDGRCRECGRRYEGTLPQGFGKPQTDETAEADPVTAETAASAGHLENDGNSEGDTLSDDETADDPADEWERRTLCPDESCIGVIGPDGRCKECGRSM